MQFLKQALKLYKENFKWVALIGLTIVVPVQFVFAFLTNYMALPFQVVGVPLWPQLVQILFMLTAVFLMHPPFISMVTQDTRFGEVKIGRVYSEGIKYMFPVYVVGLGYALLVTASMLLLVIPGLILLIGLIAIPYAAVIEDLTWWQGIKRAASIGKAKFLNILGIMLLFILIDLIISGIAYTIGYFLTTLTIGINIALMLANILILPLFIFTIAYLYMDWKNGKEKVNQRFQQQTV